MEILRFKQRYFTNKIFYAIKAFLCISYTVFLLFQISGNVLPLFW